MTYLTNFSLFGRGEKNTTANNEKPGTDPVIVRVSSTVLRTLVVDVTFVSVDCFWIRFDSLFFS